MKKIFVLVLLISLVIFSPLQAQEKKDEEPAVKLQEVVVTATRDKQEIRKAPANVTVIPRKKSAKPARQTCLNCWNLSKARRSEVTAAIRRSP
jgi:outer membrane cobalamin receptor